jgi:hypothetical protein
MPERSESERGFGGGGGGLASRPSVPAPCHICVDLIRRHECGEVGDGSGQPSRRLGEVSETESRSRPSVRRPSPAVLAWASRAHNAARFLHRRFNWSGLALGGAPVARPHHLV